MVCPQCDQVLLWNESLELIQTNKQNEFIVLHKHKSRTKCEDHLKVRILQFEEVNREEG